MAVGNNVGFKHEAITPEASEAALEELPRDIVDWLKVNAAADYNPVLIVNLYRQYGPYSLTLIKQAQAVNTAQVYSNPPFVGRLPEGLYQ